MEQYADVQQLMKRGDGQNRKPIYPPTVIQAVFDGKTGTSLEAILAQFNSIYVQYQGTPKDTRLIIPMEMRRAGLTITYMDMESNTITERANSAVQKDNDHWGLDVNWSRIDELSLSGDISVSANGTWVINGSDTGVKALGPKGDAGLTPWLKTIDNKLHFSYDNVTWDPCSENIAAWFRWNDNKIQISRDNKTWTDLSGKFADNVYIKGYVANYASLPTGAVQGDIYGVGPTYAAEDTAHANPIYRYYVRNANTWVDNGSFTSLSAGVAQETGDSETEVMSQKAVTEKLSELNGNWFTIPGYIDGNGGFVSSPTRKCTDFINVKGISSVRVKGGSNEFNVALYALYDENKNFISSASGNQYDKKLISIDIPSEAHYIRCTSNENGYGEYYGTSFKKIIGEVSQLNDSIKNNKESIVQNETDIKNMPSELGFEPIIGDYSVLELNNITLSVYGSPSMWDNGELVTLSSTSYRMAVNEKIPVVGGQTYKVSVLLGDAYTSMLVHFWNSKTNQFAQQDVDSSTLEFATPDWCDTIMFTINKAKASDINNLDVTTYGDTGYYRNNKLIVVPNEDNKSGKLCEGKKVILFGDSQLGQGRDYPSEKTNISVLLQDIVGGKVYNWGFGGCSMALRETPSTWDTFSMVSLADALVSKDYSAQDAAAVSLKSDIPYATAILNEMKAESLGDGQNIIICIAYGGNDYNNLCKLGKEDSADKTTYKGAINYAVGKLLTAYPKAKICLVGVAYRVMSYTNKTTEGITADSDSAYNIVVEDGTNQHYYRYTYNNALLEQAKYLHIAGFDKYYRSGRNKYNIWALCPNDGVHPESLAGRSSEAEFYASVLRSV